MHVILDAYPAPTRTIYPRLDGHHRPGGQSCSGSTRQPRRLVHFQPDPVTEAVPEQRAKTATLNVVTSERVGIPPEHSDPYGRRRHPVGLADDIVDPALLLRRLADDEGAGDVRAVALHLGAEVHQEKIAVPQLAPRRARVREGRALAAGDDRRERKSLAPRIAQRFF